MVFLGSQAIASPIWGLITQHSSLRVAVLAAAALVGLSAVGGVVLTVPENQHLDRTPMAYWGPTTVALDPEPDAGPIVVSIEYEVCSLQKPLATPYPLIRKSQRRTWQPNRPAPLRDYRQPCNGTGQRSVERLGSVENRMLGMHVGSHHTG